MSAVLFILFHLVRFASPFQSGGAGLSATGRIGKSPIFPPHHKWLNAALTCLAYPVLLRARKGHLKLAAVILHVVDHAGA